MAANQHREAKSGTIRHDATVRLARLLKLLSAIRQREAHRPCTATELFALADCSRSTLFRELRFLQEENLIVSQGRKGYILSDGGHAFPLLPLSAEEAMALALARSLLIRPGLPMQDLLAAALDKAASGFSSRLQDLFQEAARTPASPAERAYSHAPLLVLMQGWLEHTVIEMDYTSGGRGRQWRPLHSVSRDGRGDAVDGAWLVPAQWYDPLVRPGESPRCPPHRPGFHPS
jgi:predicted DNA-binding transcriptional regulator YafY